MQIEEGEEVAKSRGNVDRMAQDEELFYQELEEDEETRAQVQIFKDENAINANAHVMPDDDEDEEAPEVPIEELLDELSLMNRHREDEDEDGDEDLDDSMQE